eukprot:CAMPEP_0175056118 /NCGR_PEP_ID=MMETSP0052_2-20121109/10482_1 /TAXON_ID=51329 ORGANISM="Polytomella parva, Strain SAG 63-3" /NCGR_SAMPLE_ID=MMETSP0052_2 /ASSEMBLY_ACC=CAM_ASM_000194 /LENGTH=187 /DNA_ID=CAMNT_0016321087 /DNA_START=376 /DNA_END=939 /DNA_ORIENTATION=+
MISLNLSKFPLSSTREFFIDVTLTDDKAITDLNRKHLKHDYPTDVLSFHNDQLAHQDEMNECAGLHSFAMLGELVISLDTAQKQATQRGHSLHDECRILLVHGLLHLVGYDHERNAESHSEMAAAERRLMKAVKWEGQGLIDLADTCKELISDVKPLPVSNKEKVKRRNIRTSKKKPKEIDEEKSDV